MPDTDALSQRILALSADYLDAGADPFETLSAIASALGRIGGVAYASEEIPARFSQLFNIALDAAQAQREA